MEFRFLVCGLALMIVLFAAYIKSMIQLKIAIQGQTDGQANISMHIINLTLFGVLLGVQVTYTMLWQNLAKDMVIVGCIRCVIELAEKVVIFMLVNQFGSSITVKTAVHANGDLIIVGIDNNNREIFQFVISQPQSLRHDTIEISETNGDFEDYAHIQWKTLDDQQAEHMSIVT